MIDGLSEDDFLKILNAAEKIDGVVIGGQALNLWANALLSDDEFEQFGPFTSKDLDFWGTKQAAQDLASELKGRLLLPPKWDTGPSEAAVVVTLNGENHQIDFLKLVCGLNTVELLKRRRNLDVDDDLTAVVLHPLDVLKSREAGIRVLNRSDSGAIRQLLAAPIIVHHYIQTLLNEREVNLAQDAIKEMIHIGSRPAVDSLYARYGYDPLSMAATLSDREEWHPKFAKYQISDKCNREIALRTRRIAEAQRRRDHGGGRVVLVQG